VSAFTSVGSPYAKKAQEVTCIVVLDEKGRIVLPSIVRKNFGLEKGSGVQLIFSLDKNTIKLIPMVTRFSTKEKGAPYG